MIQTTAGRLLRTITERFMPQIPKPPEPEFSISESEREKTREPSERGEDFYWGWGATGHW